jgi:hypothetical protein
MTVGGHLANNFTAIHCLIQEVLAENVILRQWFFTQSALWEHDGVFSTVGLAILFVWTGAIDDSCHG